MTFIVFDAEFFLVFGLAMRSWPGHWPGVRIPRIASSDLEEEGPSEAPESRPSGMEEKY
jgi:hypothetical protein